MHPFLLVCIHWEETVTHRFCVNRFIQLPDDTGRVLFFNCKITIDSLISVGRARCTLWPSFPTPTHPPLSRGCTFQFSSLQLFTNQHLPKTRPQTDFSQAPLSSLGGQTSVSAHILWLAPARHSVVPSPNPCYLINILLPYLLLATALTCLDLP